jgi:hypothetical protein
MGCLLKKQLSDRGRSSWLFSLLFFFSPNCCLSVLPSLYPELYFPMYQTYI